jgi:hypothetical protein
MLFIILIIIIIIMLGVVIYLSKRNNDSDNDDEGVKNKNVNTDLGKYFSNLFPIGSWTDDKKDTMEKLYLNLDCWYTKMLPQYEKQIINSLPDFHINRMRIWNDPPEGIIWEKLFDGSVCDCMRFAYPVCNHPRSRFGGKDILKDCPLWPGLNVGKTYETLLKQAYNSNNKDNNWVKDNFTKNGKGFPNNSWVEGLAYPGEYGHPDVCGPLPDYLKASQPGLTYKDDNGNFVPLNLPYSSGPWFDSQCQNGSCPVSSLTCKYVKSDGTYPTGQDPNSPLQGNYCVDANAFKEEYTNLPQSIYNMPIRSYSNFIYNDSPALVEGKTLPKDITTPDTQGYHGLWLYPLRGVGMWRNLGNTVVANTKLGYLIADKDKGGLGYNLEDMLELVGPDAGAPQNLQTQVSRLTEIINKGYVRKTKDFTAMSLSDLNTHLYAPLKKINQKVDNYNQARNLALNIIKTWYIDGYNGFTSDKKSKYYNGFNYNYSLFFPLGTQFSYAARFDNLVLANMVQNKIDTLQLVIEPQAAKAGLRPGYYFEIFQTTPTKQIKGESFSVYTDTNNNQCKSFYMVNPAQDLDNYINYGYVSGSKVKDQEVFNPQKMKFTASRVSFDL